MPTMHCGYKYDSVVLLAYKFTGKERDAESGLDNFGARYDSSALGRFMTPDWAARPTTVPYAVFGDPQSLNLYGYVRNDPVSSADADGHFGVGDYSSPVTGIQLFNEGSQVNGNVERDEGEASDEEWLAQGEVIAQLNQNEAAAQSNNPINMSVSVSQEPQIMENLKVGDKTMTGVGAQLEIALTDKGGKPISGSVTESNKEGGMQTPGAVTLTNGALKDYVGKFGDASKMPGTVADLKSYATTNPITVTSTQTLNISAGKASYQATWTRTLSNVGANGKLNTTFNSHGMNFTIRWTDPVIKAISP